MNLPELQPPTMRRILRFFLIFPLLFLLMLLCAGIRWLDGAGPYDNRAALSDLDSDGDLDVFLNNLRFESPTILWAGTTLWYNQGGGRFTPVNLYSLLDQQSPTFSAGADVDRDEDIDLVGITIDRMVLVLNQNGQYAPHNGTAPHGYHSQYRSLTLGDLNGDGQVDGFVAGCCGMKFSEPYEGYDPPTSFIWLNNWNPRGWMDYTTLSLPSLDNLPIHAVALGDLDGDTDLDLFAAVQQPAESQNFAPGSRVLFNDGSGKLVDSGQHLGQAAYGVALGDIDNDDDLDALTGTSSGADVWLNPGNGVFTGSSTTLPGQETRAIFLSDLDGDHDLDAVLAGKTYATIWRNDGQGHFRRANQRLRYTERHALTLADFNGDGFPDAFAAAYAETYTLWFNNGKGVFLLQTH